MHRIVSQIVKAKSNCVYVHGLHGIGKELVTKTAMNFLGERTFFTGGIVYVNMQGIRTIDLFYRTIYTALQDQPALQGLRFATPEELAKLPRAK